MHNAFMIDTPADRLKAARIAKGYNDAADAAHALKVPYPTYAGHENGSRGLGRNATKYARLFRVRYEWLMTGNGPMKGPGDEHPLIELYEKIIPEKRAEVFDYLAYMADKWKQPDA